MFNLLVKINAEEQAFLAAVRAAMERYFGDDQKRIEHALQVSVYAGELLAYIEADPLLTLSAAYLHDIGIHEAERKHGSSSGKWQELEGPPIAAGLLDQIGAERGFVSLVTHLVGKHHTPRGVDSAEFRILWDADALVNFAELLPCKTPEQIEALIQGHMVTEPGFRIARRLFLNPVSNDGVQDRTLNGWIEGLFRSSCGSSDPMQ